jgi:lipopolysaccharide export system permease protein
MNQADVNEGEISNTNTMLNIGELRYTLDSLNTNFKKDVNSFSENIYQRSGVLGTFNNAVPTTTDKKLYSKDIIDNIEKSKRTEILRIATSTIENTGFSIDSSIIELTEKQKNINNHWIALYDKYVIAFACILMFFIGAPLGSIIRKGGLGLPIVFAVTIFIIFHFINTFGKKVAQENGIPPFLGCWMSTIVLTPLAILLTYRATNDIGGMINMDGITAPFQKLYLKIFPKQK